MTKTNKKMLCGKCRTKYGSKHGRRLSSNWDILNNVTFKGWKNKQTFIYREKAAESKNKRLRVKNHRYQFLFSFN